MPRPHYVKKARKSYKADGIKKGDPYWWWKFNFGPKIRSKTQPRASQLTRSDFYATLYDLQDDVESLVAGDGLKDAVSDIADRIRTLGEECADRLSNMPDSLQESDTGNLLQERSDACEAAADEFEAIDFEIDQLDDDEDAEADPEQAHWDEKLEEVKAISLEID